jgi:zinc/manganese transport system ATP-binding protein
MGGGLAFDEMSMPAQLDFQNVTLGYDRHPAVHHLTGEVASGALLAVIGPNGAGKSTLLRGVAGILKPLAGAISLDGIDHRDIAYLPQTSEIDRSFPISVFDLVGTGLWRSIGFLGGIGKKERAQIASALAAVGLTGFENRGIGTLSGGQMQRLLFARVLLQDARLIVLDEPFNAIDTKTSADLLALVKHWHAEERTVLAALHDLDMVRTNFPDTLLLARGPVAWGPTAQVLTSDNLTVAMRMCEAFDDAAAACVVDMPSRAA